MTLGFLFGSKNSCKLLCVSWEVFVLHGYDWIHWVARSYTTTAYRWLFRDSQLSLRTLWSPVIKAPNLSARGTAPPMRLLHGALVIFGPLTGVQTLCLPKSTLLVGVGSQDSSWEELACESNVFRNSVISQDSLWILAATPGCRNTTGRTVLSRGFRFYLVLDFGLAWATTGLTVIWSLQHVKLTQALDGNLSHSDLPFFQSHYRLTKLWLV